MKYTPETVEKICNFITLGVFAKDACICCDVGEATFYEWKKNKPEFQEAIKKAESMRKATLLKEIRMDRTWQSKAWMLERICNKEYGKDSYLVARLDDIERRLDEKEVSK